MRRRSFRVVRLTTPPHGVFLQQARFVIRWGCMAPKLLAGTVRGLIITVLNSFVPYFTETTPFLRDSNKLTLTSLTRTSPQWSVHQGYG
jgi:hypothetical protein